MNNFQRLIPNPALVFNPQINFNSVVLQPPRDHIYFSSDKNKSSENKKGLKYKSEEKLK